MGRWVFHHRERTVVVRALDDALALHTMRLAAELVDPRDFDLGRVRTKPSEKEITTQAPRLATTSDGRAKMPAIRRLATPDSHRLRWAILGSNQ